MTSLWNRASQKTSIVSGVNWTLTHTPVCWTRDSLRERERGRGERVIKEGLRERVRARETVILKGKKRGS